MNGETIAERVAALRQKLGWSQSELARRAGIRQQAVSRLESGAVERPREVGAIARALGTSAEHLIYGTGAPPVGVEDRDQALVRVQARDGETVSWMRLPRSVLAWRGVSPTAELCAMQLGPMDSQAAAGQVGDFVVIDRSHEKVTDDGLYLVELDTRRLLRACRLRLEDGAVVVRGPHGDEQAIPVPQLARLRTLGRAVLAIASI